MCVLRQVPHAKEAFLQCLWRALRRIRRGEPRFRFYLYLAAKASEFGVAVVEFPVALEKVAALNLQLRIQRKVGRPTCT